MCECVLAWRSPSFSSFSLFCPFFVRKACGKGGLSGAHGCEQKRQAAAD
jgi:hypothetical protein